MLEPCAGGPRGAAVPLAAQGAAGAARPGWAGRGAQRAAGGGPGGRVRMTGVGERDHGAGDARRGLVAICRERDMPSVGTILQLDAGPAAEVVSAFKTAPGSEAWQPEGHVEGGPCRATAPGWSRAQSPWPHAAAGLWRESRTMSGGRG